MANQTEMTQLYIVTHLGVKYYYSRLEQAMANLYLLRRFGYFPKLSHMFLDTNSEFEMFNY
jgi:hypothetical protein